MRGGVVENGGLMKLNARLCYGVLILVVVRLC